jgi:hypothetical protein
VKEKRINIDKIDHSKDLIWEALGISEEEFKLALEEVSIRDMVASVANNFSEEELLEALKRCSIYSEAIAFLWKRKNRTYITLEEFLSTFIALKELKKFKEEKELEDTVRMVLFILFRDEGIAFALTPILTAKLIAEQEIFKEVVKLVRERGEGKDEDEKTTSIKIDLIREIQRLKPSVAPEVKAEFEEYLRRWKEGMIQKILKAKNIQELKKALLS